MPCKLISWTEWKERNLIDFTTNLNSIATLRILPRAVYESLRTSNFLIKWTVNQDLQVEDGRQVSFKDQSMSGHLVKKAIFCLDLHDYRDEAGIQQT